jgi:hypothetical protein
LFFLILGVAADVPNLRLARWSSQLVAAMLCEYFRGLPQVSVIVQSCSPCLFRFSVPMLSTPTSLQPLVPLDVLDPPSYASAGAVATTLFDHVPPRSLK